MAVEVESDDFLDRAPAQVGVGRALRDAEEKLPVGARRLALTSCPDGRQAHSLFELLARRVRGRADVEAHRDVRAQLGLDLGGELRREPLRRPVVHRAERDALIVSREDRVLQREDLVAARVGEDRPVPAHEAVQAAELGDHVLARAEVQVVRVAEEDRSADRAQLVGVDGLDGRLGADGHEGRRLDLAVRRVQHARARLAVCGRDREAHRISMASPKE